DLAAVVQEGIGEVDVGTPGPPGLRLEAERKTLLQVLPPTLVTEIGVGDAARVEHVRQQLLVTLLLGHPDRPLRELDALAIPSGDRQKTGHLRHDEQLLPGRRKVFDSSRSSLEVR